MTERMIENRVNKLRELEAQQKELEAQAEAIRAELKADLDEKGPDKAGCRKPPPTTTRGLVRPLYQPPARKARRKMIS